MLKIQHRIDVFTQITKTQKTIFPTLITAFGAISNEHFTGFIQQELSLENLIN